jgi:tripeptidyl-peptidase-1
VPKVPGINKIGFNKYLNQTPIRPDIYQFLDKYRPEAAGNAWTFKSIEIAGGPAAQYIPLTAAEIASDPGNFAKEANLDAQTILGMTFPAPVYS